MTCRHEQTIEYVIVQAPDQFSHKFFIRNRLKQSKVLDNGYKQSFYSPSVLIIYPQKQKIFYFSLAQDSLSVFFGVHRESFQRKPAKHEKTSLDLVLKQSLFSPEKIIWEPERDVLASEKHYNS